MKKGFTLMEIVVSLGLLALIGLVVNQILFNTLRGSLKGEVVKTVKQHGDYALSVMENDIRNAKSIIQCTSGPPTMLQIRTTLTPKTGYDSVELWYSIYDKDKAGSTVPWYILKKIYDRNGTNPPVLREEIPLTDFNKVRGFDPASSTFSALALTFSCTPSTPPYKTVSIKFSLQSNVEAAAHSEERALIPFRSQVTLRNR